MISLFMAQSKLWDETRRDAPSSGGRLIVARLYRSSTIEAAV
jgi:hypothetical protein